MHSLSQLNYLFFFGFRRRGISLRLKVKLSFLYFICHSESRHRQGKNLSSSLSEMSSSLPSSLLRMITSSRSKDGVAILCHSLSENTGN